MIMMLVVVLSMCYQKQQYELDLIVLSVAEHCQAQTFRFFPQFHCNYYYYFLRQSPVVARNLKHWSFLELTSVTVVGLGAIVKDYDVRAVSVVVIVTVVVVILIGDTVVIVIIVVVGVAGVKVYLVLIFGSDAPEEASVAVLICKGHRDVLY